jgi:hypothetical protein
MLTDFLVLSINFSEDELTSYEKSFLYKLDVALGHRDHTSKCVVSKPDDKLYLVNYRNDEGTIQETFDSKKDLFYYLKSLKESA